MSQVKLSRLDSRGRWHLLVTYGQEQEFHNALPLLVGPYQEVHHFAIRKTAIRGVKIMEIERNGCEAARYRIEGLMS